MRVGAGLSVDVPGVATARAALKVEFTAGFGAYVGLAGMRFVSPLDLTRVERELVRRVKLPVDSPDHWDPRFRIVTHLVTAKKATVLMSRTAGSKIVMQAKGDIPEVDFADAELGLETLYDDTSEEQFVPERAAAADCTPFFWLMKIDFGLFGLVSGKGKLEAYAPPDVSDAREASLIAEGPAFDPKAFER